MQMTMLMSLLTCAETCQSSQCVFCTCLISRRGRKITMTIEENNNFFTSLIRLSLYLCFLHVDNVLCVMIITQPVSWLTHAISPDAVGAPFCPASVLLVAILGGAFPFSGDIRFCIVALFPFRALGIVSCDCSDVVQAPPPHCEACVHCELVLRQVVGGTVAMLLFSCCRPK
jgi:hypothetical protein